MYNCLKCYYDALCTVDWATDQKQYNMYFHHISRILLHPFNIIKTAILCTFGHLMFIAAISAGGILATEEMLYALGDYLGAFIMG